MRVQESEIAAQQRTVFFKWCLRVLAALCVLNALSIRADETAQRVFVYHPGTGALSHVRENHAAYSLKSLRNFGPSIPAEKAASEYLNLLFKQVNASDEIIPGMQSVDENLELLGVQVDNFGSSHVRFRQIYEGIPVEGSEVVVHLLPDGSVHAASFHTLSLNGLSAVPLMSAASVEHSVTALFIQSALAQQARKIKHDKVLRSCQRLYPNVNRIQKSRCFRKRFRRRKRELRPTVREAELIFYSERFLTGKEPDDLRLVWSVTMHDREGMHQEDFLVDAQTSELLNRKRGIDGLNRLVYDCSRDTNAFDLNVKKTYQFDLYEVDYYHGRSEGQAQRGPSPLSGSYLGSEDVDNFYDEISSLHSYYLSKFQRNGANANGGLVLHSNFSASDETRIFTHVDNNQVLGPLCEKSVAFSGPHYIGLCADAEASHSDILGHEYAHFLTRNMGASANSSGPSRALNRMGESGSLLEALSDFFGEAYERYRNGGHHDWKISSPGDNPAFSRNIAQPEDSFDSTIELDDFNGFPAHYQHGKFYCSSGDNGGAHINSVVMSKAFQLMVDGTAHGMYNGCKLKGIGFEKVEQILYYALNVYFISAMDFHRAYEDILQSCSDLAFFSHAGINAADCEEVDLALQALQLDQPGGCGNFTPAAPTCGSGIVVEVNPLPGDFNRDGAVNGGDFLFWQREVNKSVAPGSGADANGDGVVTGDDLVVWKENYGNTLQVFLPGDFNRDGSVNGSDYLFWQRQANTSVPPGTGADANSDGFVDGADLEFWKENYGKSS